MSVDREQIRRVAEAWLNAGPKPTLLDTNTGIVTRKAATFADYCLALLAELEQAEKERDEALDRPGAELGWDGATTALERAEARLEQYEQEAVQYREALNWVPSKDSIIDPEALDEATTLGLLKVYIRDLEARLTKVPPLVEALTKIADTQPAVLAYVQANGFVFEEIGNERGNWQHLAFSIYTDLCQVDTEARAALTAWNESG